MINTVANWDEFLRAYTQCQDAELKSRAIASALAAINAERRLTLKAVAAHYGVSVQTAGRWALPSHEWLGRKWYRISDCDRYLQSQDFKQRLAFLREGRREHRRERLPRASQLATGDVATPSKGRPGRHPLLVETTPSV